MLTAFGPCRPQSIGRSRGGLTTKVHYAIDGLDVIRPVLTSPGQQAGCRRAVALATGLTPFGLTPLAVVGGKGCDAGGLRGHWRALARTGHGRAAKRNPVDILDGGQNLVPRPRRDRVIIYKLMGSDDGDAYDKE